MIEVIWNFEENNNQLESDSNDQLSGLDFGLSVIPVNSNKIPLDSWKEYQHKISPTSYWHSHYISQGYIGIITGKVSGNAECIDIDVKNDPKKSIYNEFVALIPIELFSRLIIQSTVNKGYHLIYRCPEAVIDKNLKLAKHSDKAVIIETRGEGGYFCTHSVDYKILQGHFDFANLEINIPIITAKEREFLLETARSLNRFFPVVKTKANARIDADGNSDTTNTTNVSISKNVFTYNDPVINEFNDKYSVIELFTRHGWEKVGEDQDKVFLLRQGSLASHSGYYFKANKVFYCFSSSTDFAPEKPYNHFQVLQVLEGKNDYKTTLRLLTTLGFEVKGNKPDKVGADEISEYLNGIGIRYDSFIQDLTINGKIVEELDYNTIFIDLKKHFDKEVPRTRFEETIKSHYTTTINPIMDFVNANIDRNPIGVFEEWLDCIVLKNKSIDKSLVIHFVKKWYVGMIAQALGGEYPNEFFLTLLSTEQGIGKTSLLRNHTLPIELHAYRKEHSLSFDDDFQVLMSQALLIIDDEMDGRTYEADKTFKTILSTKELTMRRKYDRRISTLKRRCSFAGSGNHLYVVREQQNRRIIPVEIEKIHFGKLAEVDYIDLFMEAYHLFASGFEYSYQRQDMPLLKKLYDDYVQRSDVDLILDEYLQKPETIGDSYYITNLDLVNVLIIKYPHFSKRINVPTIGKLMIERGYETMRKGKARLTCYQINRNSRITQLLGDDSQSWRLNHGEIVG